MPRILCLHGHGTSAAIFKAQTAALRAELGPAYIFDFPDAPLPSNPSPGIEAFFGEGVKAGTYTWWPLSPRPEAVRAAHRRLRNWCLRRGPSIAAGTHDDAQRSGNGVGNGASLNRRYHTGHGASKTPMPQYDAVLAFSQGCSVAATMALYDAAASARSLVRSPFDNGSPKAGDGLPFRSAIFICGGLPLGILEQELGVPVPQQAKDMDAHTSKQLRELAGRLTELAQDPAALLQALRGNARPGQRLWDTPPTTPDTEDGCSCCSDEDAHSNANSNLKEKPSQNVYGLNFANIDEELRIRVPAAIIYGRKDPKYPASIQLSHFCEDKVVYDHGGGHDIPRTKAVTKDLADLVRETIRKGACSDELSSL